jgi:hypothetical protein
MVPERAPPVFELTKGSDVSAVRQWLLHRLETPALKTKEGNGFLFQTVDLIAICPKSQYWMDYETQLDDYDG